MIWRMSFAVVHTRALDGLGGAPVTVEVHLANGLPSFTLVGLADVEVKEARDDWKNISCRTLKRRAVSEKLPVLAVAIPVFAQPG